MRTVLLLQAHALAHVYMQNSEVRKSGVENGYIFKEKINAVKTNTSEHLSLLVFLPHQKLANWSLCFLALSKH